MNTMVFVGSTALRRRGIVVDRPRLDQDLICTAETFIKWVKVCCENGDQKIIEVQPMKDGDKMYAKVLTCEKKVFVYEAELAWDNSIPAELIELLLADPKTQVDDYDGIEVLTPSLDVLYMLKMTHRYLKNSPHFLKTMADIHMLRKLGCEIPKAYKKWYKARIKATYNYSHPKLNVSKKSFFSDDNIDYKYDHDSIHEAIKHLDTPAYDKFKPDSAEVFTSKEMFFKMPLTWQLLATLEESYVLSLERAIIPFDLKTPDQRLNAFKTALMKVCTSITSGWFREFSWENYHTVMAMYDQEYVERFYRAVEAGSVKPFTKAAY